MINKHQFIYFLGILQTLYDQNLLPRIISGASAGSIVASYFCTRPIKEAIQVLIFLSV